jgi:transcriptional regulator with XRE-family HTH domain
MGRSPGQAFGDALRQVRKERGLSQEAAALKIGVDRANFGRIERSVKSPTLDTIFKIASGLETQPSELLARTERLLRD